MQGLYSRKQLQTRICGQQGEGSVEDFAWRNTVWLLQDTLSSCEGILLDIFHNALRHAERLCMTTWTLRTACQTSAIRTSQVQEFRLKRRHRNRNVPYDNV